jgi:DNA modification methylase
MRWLVTVTEPGETILDPFMGSGTTGVACALEGRRFIGADMLRGNVETAKARILEASGQQVRSRSGAAVLDLFGNGEA